MPDFEMRSKKYTLKTKNEALVAAGLQDPEEGEGEGESEGEGVIKKKRKRIVAAPKVATEVVGAVVGAME